MKHKYKYWLIKNNEIYTTKEISELLNIHTRTIQLFIKTEGLEVLNPNSKKYLIKGVILKNFLQNRIKSQKSKLKYYEFNCFHCKKPVESIPEEIIFIDTGKKLSKNTTKIDIKGICKECGSKLYRVSSESKKKEIEEYYLKKLE